MSQTNWSEILGWGQREVDDLRFVGYSYIKQGMYETALTFFNAIKILSEPTLYDLQTVGALYLQLSDGNKALEYLNQALQLDPSHIPSKLNRAKALLLLGYYQQGIDEAKKVQISEDKELRDQAAALILSNM